LTTATDEYLVDQILESAMTLLPDFTAVTNDDRGSPARLMRMLWLVALVGGATLATGIYACATPFSAVAAMAALTLPRRAAVMSVVLLWLGNQIIGFGVAGYPLTANAFAWGAALLVAVIVSTLAAAPVRDALREQSTVIRFVAAFAAAFVSFQLVCALTSVLFDESQLGLAVIAEIAQINAVWAVGLLAAHSVLGAAAHANQPLVAR
jgi:hypothetical protein